MRFIKIFIALGFIISISQAKAQTCGSCTVRISNESTGSYTVNTGQTFCIDSLGKFTGTITLNGGSICNKGIFRPKTFNVNSGSFYNYARTAFDGNFTLGSNSTFYCDHNAVMRINGVVTITGGTLTNHGVTNIKDDLIYTTGTFNNSGLINCKLFSGTSGSYTNTGTINNY